MARKPSIFLILLLFVACESPKRDATSHFKGVAMAMPYHIQLGELRHPREEIESLIAQTFDEVNHTVNRWNPESEISQVNRTLSTVPSGMLKALLKCSDDAVKLTQGYFDPSLGYWSEISFSETTLEKGEHALNFDGIAKGFTVDLLTDRLKKLGYENIYVEWAGEITCFGSHPEKRPWLIGLRTPSRPEIFKTIELEEGSIATSGDTFYQTPTERGLITHIFHPKKKKWLRIKEGSVASVTVKASSCTLADALATAAMVHGKDAPHFLETLKETHPELEYWIIYR